MIKTVSFDLWMTLIGGNPQFKREKYELIRGYFRLSHSDEQLAAAFARADKLLDRIQERYLMQPDNLTAWAIVLDAAGLAETSADDIKSFLQTYNQLFLEFPPLLFDDVEFLFEKLAKIENLNYFILSNTILVTGETLDKFLKQTFLRDVKSFYSDSHFPKPDGRAFETLPTKPDFHVGDNLITDGGCTRFGVEFYQVRTNGKSLVDFWQHFEAQL